MHTFKIHAPLNTNNAFVEMDGKRLEGITRVEFALAAGQIVEVKLTVFGYVDITGEFRETEIVRAAREDARPETLRVRVRRALLSACPGTDAEKIETMVAAVMQNMETT